MANQSDQEWWRGMGVLLDWVLLKRARRYYRGVAMGALAVGMAGDLLDKPSECHCDVDDPGSEATSVWH